MTDFLYLIYPWAKSLHMISVISWMAGLLYLPRLFVHHVERGSLNSDTKSIFEMMEVKLFRLIMNPAMVAAWVFGLILVFTPGLIDWSEWWPWVKTAAVLVLTWYHHWLGRRRKELILGSCTITGKQFRIMNEVPTVLMIVIVIMVIVRPF